MYKRIRHKLIPQCNIKIILVMSVNSWRSLPRKYDWISGVKNNSIYNFYQMKERVQHILKINYPWAIEGNTVVVFSISQNQIYIYIYQMYCIQELYIAIKLMLFFFFNKKQIYNTWHICLLSLQSIDLWYWLDVLAIKIEYLCSLCLHFGW